MENRVAPEWHRLSVSISEDRAHGSRRARPAPQTSPDPPQVWAPESSRSRARLGPPPRAHPACLLAVPGAAERCAVSDGAADPPALTPTTRASGADPAWVELGGPECNGRPFSGGATVQQHGSRRDTCSPCGEAYLHFTGASREGLRAGCLSLEFHSQDIGHVLELQVSPWSLGELREFFREQLQLYIHYSIQDLKTSPYGYLPSGIFTPGFWSCTMIWERFKIQQYLPPPPQRAIQRNTKTQPAPTFHCFGEKVGWKCSKDVCSIPPHHSARQKLQRGCLESPPFFGMRKENSLNPT